MSLFKKADHGAAFLKAGLYGEAGSGKTLTASKIALGLAKYIQKKGLPLPAVMFVDTETGSNWVKPMFDEAGIDFYVARTRAFEDLKQAVNEAESAGAILIADSVTHFWEEVREAFLAQKRKRLRNQYARLELPDWNAIKPEWGKFTTMFLNSNCHIIVCGRSGNVYEFQDDEDTNKKQMITTGTRMAAEKGLGYEPNLLIEMTSRQAKEGGKKSIIRIATVLKDRSTLLDGEQFEQPEFANFLPHIKRLNIGGEHAGIDTSRTSERLFPSSDRRDNTTQRAIVLDEIQALLVLHHPGQSAEDKRRKVQLLRDHFSAQWAEIEKVMPLEDLRAGYDKMHRELEKKPSRYTIADGEIDDAIPETGGGELASKAEVSTSAAEEEKSATEAPKSAEAVIKQAPTATDETGAIMQAGFEAFKAGMPRKKAEDLYRYVKQRNAWFSGWDKARELAASAEAAA